jgi:uncharacterized phage-associated protein
MSTAEINQGPAPQGPTPAHAEVVARHLLHVASQEQEGELPTQMHVHKLLYYAQGWSLAVFGGPLFAGAIQAWKHGPVVMDIRQRFSQFGDRAIAPSEARDGIALPIWARNVVTSTWRSFGQYSAWRLREMTHAEPPWRDARGDIPDTADSKAVITNDAMQEYFTSRHDQHCAREGLKGEDVRAALREAYRAPGMPWSEAVRPLRAQ